MDFIAVLTAVAGTRGSYGTQSTDSESIVPKLGLILLVVHKAVQKPLRRQNGQGHCTARSWFIDSGALARFYKSLEISESRIIGIQLQHRTESIDLSIFGMHSRSHQDPR